MQTLRNRTFRTDENQTATVWEVRRVGVNVTGFSGLGRTVRTFVTVEGDSREFDCEPGCSFQAERVVREGRRA